MVHLVRLQAEAVAVGIFHTHLGLQFLQEPISAIRLDPEGSTEQHMTTSTEEMERPLRSQPIR